MKTMRTSVKHTGVVFLAFVLVLAMCGGAYAESVGEVLYNQYLEYKYGEAYGYYTVLTPTEAQLPWPPTQAQFDAYMASRGVNYASCGTPSLLWCNGYTGSVVPVQACDCDHQVSTYANN
jgi:hypothetical protein